MIASAAALLATAAGLAAWAGTVLVGAPLGLAAALAGALNALPVALLCLGAALFALGWLPQAALPVGVLPAAGGYLLQLLAESFGWPPLGGPALAVRPRRGCPSGTGGLARSRGAARRGRRPRRARGRPLRPSGPARLTARQLARGRSSPIGFG
ncbi:MAG TPA: hypothetical protein VKP64_13520 [Mycobacteriales bacterium]|nr:hypothetical protein [Mycobacteriales bacterium]